MPKSQLWKINIDQVIHEQDSWIAQTSPAKDVAVSNYRPGEGAAFVRALA